MRVIIVSSLARLLIRSSSDRSGIFIGYKGRRFTIHKSIFSTRVVLLRFLRPGYIPYLIRGLSKGGHWHVLSFSLSSFVSLSSFSLDFFWDLQVTLPVTPRKLDLTTLTGPNCFLPPIRPWPILHMVLLEKKFQDQLHIDPFYLILWKDLDTFTVPNILFIRSNIWYDIKYWINNNIFVIY